MANLYDVKAFLSDIRLYQTLLVLVAVWLIYIVGYATRFGPVDRTHGRQGTAMFLARTGNFLARTTSRAEINRRLLSRFNNALHTYADEDYCTEDWKPATLVLGSSAIC